VSDIEQALEESESNLKTIMNTVLSGIYIVNKEGNFLDGNPAMENLTGYKIEELLGTSFAGLLKEDQIDQGMNVFGRILKGEDVSGTIEINHKTKGYRTVSYTQTLKNDVIIGSSTDITDIINDQKALKVSLDEKDILLHEIHHRVKNNMQVINSLLKLQSNNIEDEQTKEILKDSQSRVYAMSAVHETLHGSENLSEIDLKSYLSKITTSIFQTYSVNHGMIKLNSDVEGLPISLNQAYPLGLVINELISNSLKYAFPDERKGEINVNMKKQDQKLQLTVIDDGVGIPDDLDWKNSKSLGLKLVRTLVENQLDGSIDMENKNGTKFIIKFNIEI
jgi:PAS domain S-box-containing protein